jgi:hypothetical protein
MPARVLSCVADATDSLVPKDKHILPAYLPGEFFRRKQVIFLRVPEGVEQPSSQPHYSTKADQDIPDKQR